MSWPWVQGSHHVLEQPLTLGCASGNHLVLGPRPFVCLVGQEANSLPTSKRPQAPVGPAIVILGENCINLCCYETCRRLDGGKLQNQTPEPGVMESPKRAFLPELC